MDISTAAEWPRIVVRRARGARYGLAAAALSLAALVIGLHWGSFVAGGSDSSGYVSQSALWLRGEIIRPRPAWIADAPWPLDLPTTPLGYRPGTDPHTMVPVYAPGLPLLMAALRAAAGEGAVYYVVPILGAVTVWVTFLLGRRVGGPSTGLLASALMLSSPAFLYMLVQPMSDVPAAALWTTAAYFALRPRTGDAGVAGVAAAMAILVRPNLSPLTALFAALVWLGRPRPARAFLFIALAGAATAAAFLFNDRLYGSPFVSGYGPSSYLYSMERVWPNLARYPVWLVTSQTPVVLLAFVAPRYWPAADTSRIVLSSITCVFPLTLLAAYLPFFVYDAWWYLRFLLPAYPALCIGTAGVLVALARRLPRRWPGVVLAATTGGLIWHGFTYSNVPFGPLERSERRFVEAADYVRGLPPRSVIVALVHSGSVHYYTGRDVLRWEGFAGAPERFDAAIRYLRSKRYDVYLVADRAELSEFHRLFGDSEVAAAVRRDTPAVLADVVVYRLAGSTPLQAASAAARSASATGSAPRAPRAPSN